VEERKLFPSEAALLIGLFINSFSICLMVESGFGFSSISSFPYVCSLSLPFMSMGAWNYAFQTVIIISLMILRKKLNPAYFLTFIIGIIFGNLIDFYRLFVPLLPNHFLLHILYFFIGFVIIAIGLCLMVNCKLPIIPTDIFPRDFAHHFQFPYHLVKTYFDLACLLGALAVSLICSKQVIGIGIGTIFCSVLTGKVVAIINKFVSHRFYFAPVTPFFKKLV
jgi:uncharacterized membrane protein YczE